MMRLTEPTWFVADIARKDLKALMRRTNTTGLARYAGWLGLLIASGWISWLSLGTVWAVPAFFIYGTLYCFAEPILHECSHGTAFKDRWLNETIYFLTSLLLFKERNYHRWMHARHHSHTIITGKDPEIQFPRPTSLFAFFVLEPFKILNAKQFIVTLVSHAFSRPTENTEKWVPENVHRNLFFWSRIQLLIYLVIIGGVVWFEVWVIFLFLFGPRFYGGFIHNMVAATQHVGLRDNVNDHRLNSRTVILGPVLSFLYWNMNYHLEHHMFPLVPFHHLPQLNEKIKKQTPKPYQNMAQAYNEMVRTIWRQQSDPEYMVTPDLPPNPSSTA